MYNNAHNNTSTNKRKSENLSPHVQAAVNDILYNHNINSAHEWLQRRYIRLMRREAAMKSESKLKTEVTKVPQEASKQNHVGDNEHSA